MNVFLVRHAKAGSRSRWRGDDEARPLTKAGRRQAEALVDLLGGRGVTELRSSPYTRCAQTLAPLGRHLDVPITPDDALEEGRGGHEALAIITKARSPLALCSHGDVILEVMTLVERRGVALDDDRIEKGSTWVLRVEDGEVQKARYLPPPG